MQGLRGSAAAAAAAADQADLDGVGDGLRGDDGGKTGHGAERTRGCFKKSRRSGLVDCSFILPLITLSGQKSNWSILSRVKTNGLPSIT